MTDLEVLFLFEKSLTGWEQKSLDTWISASPWGKKPGTFSIWALSYGQIPENFMQASGLVAVGSKATQFLLGQDGLTMYTQGLKPRPMKPDAKLVNRVYKVSQINGFGNFKFLLVLKTAGQIMMSTKFAEQSGFPVRPVGDKKTIESLWALWAAVHAVPIKKTDAQAPSGADTLSSQ